MPVDRTTWQTPPELVEKLVRAYGPLFLDPCTADDNPLGAQHFFTKETNGLRSWPAFIGKGLVFINWPYSARNNPVWAAHVQAEAMKRRGDTTIAALVPVATSTKWWRSLRPNEYHFLPNRIAHVDPDTGLRVTGSNFDSAVLVWTSYPCKNPFGLERWLV